MQNRYVGDVADFGKYGLLRFLSGHTAQDELDPLPLARIHRRDEVTAGEWMVRARLRVEGPVSVFSRRRETL